MEKVNWRTAFFCFADRSLPCNLSTYFIFFLSFLRIFFYLHGIFIAAIAPLSKSMGATKYYFAKYNNTIILFVTITRIIYLVLYTMSTSVLIVDCSALWLSSPQSWRRRTFSAIQLVPHDWFISCASSKVDRQKRARWPTLDYRSIKNYFQLNKWTISTIQSKPIKSK